MNVYEYLGILGILAIIALLKGSWLSLALLIGILVGLFLGWDFENGGIEILLTSAVLYFAGKFIGRKITEHNTRAND